MSFSTVLVVDTCPRLAWQSLKKRRGAGVIPVELGEDLAVAVLGLLEVHPVLVEDAEVDRGRRGGPGA